MHCPDCQLVNENGAKFCQRCGKDLRAPEPVTAALMRGQGTSVATAVPADKVAVGKNAGLATVLSLFIVGAGQFYNRDTKKGLVMLSLAIVGGIFTLGWGWAGVAIWSAIDAYSVAARKWPRW